MIWSSRGSAPNDGWSAGFITIDSRSLRDLIFGLSIWILYIVVLYIVLLYFLRLFLPSVYFYGGDARVCFYPIDSSCLRDLVLDWYTMFERFILISISILILHLSNYSFLFLDYTSVILLLYFCYTSVILLLYFCYTSLTLPPSILTFGLYWRRGCAGPVLSVWFIIFWEIYTSFNTRCSRDLSWIKYFNSTTILSTYSFLFLDYSSVTHLLTILRLFLPSVYFYGGGAPVRFYPFDSSCSRDLSSFNTRCSYWFTLRLYI